MALSYSFLKIRSDEKYNTMHENKKSKEPRTSIPNKNTDQKKSFQTKKRMRR